MNDRPAGKVQRPAGANRGVLTANASEYPHNAQMTDISPIRKTHCIITPSTFFLRTKPL
jgi:hypothetical protein